MEYDEFPWGKCAKGEKPLGKHGEKEVGEGREGQV